MKFACFVYLLVIACIPSSARAQCDRDKQRQAIRDLGMQVKVQFDDYGIRPWHIPSWIEGNIAQRSSGDPVDSALTALRAIASVYCATPADDFRYAGTMSKPDGFGQTFVEIHQTYRDLEVIGTSLRVHLTHDSVDSIRGNFRPDINLSIDPVLSNRDAVRIAVRDIARNGRVNYRLRGVRGPVVYVKRPRQSLSRICGSIGVPSRWRRQIRRRSSS